MVFFISRSGEVHIFRQYVVHETLAVTLIKKLFLYFRVLQPLQLHWLSLLVLLLFSRYLQIQVTVLTLRSCGGFVGACWEGEIVDFTCCHILFILSKSGNLLWTLGLLLTSLMNLTDSVRVFPAF